MIDVVLTSKIIAFCDEFLLKKTKKKVLDKKSSTFFLLFFFAFGLFFAPNSFDIFLILELLK